MEKEPERKATFPVEKDCFARCRTDPDSMCNVWVNIKVITEKTSTAPSIVYILLTMVSILATVIICLGIYIKYGPVDVNGRQKEEEIQAPTYVNGERRNARGYTTVLVTDLSGNSTVEATAVNDSVGANNYIEITEVDSIGYEVPRV